MITAADSKYTPICPPWLRSDSGNHCGAIVAITLKPYAAPVPMAISVNMFNERWTIDCQPRSKIGQPHSKTTGVASANCSQRSAVELNQCSNG